MNRRKNFVGNVSNRFHRAASVAIFIRVEILSTAIVRTMLSDAVVTEMSAVGGVILIGMALNLLGCTRERIRVANMLPAIFLPILYLALFA